MSRRVVKIPATLDLSNALKLSIELAELRDVTEICADFNGVGLVEPFAMLMVSSELQRAAARNQVELFRCVNHERMTYAAHMGFFAAFGYEDTPRKAGGGQGSSRYLPLNIYECEALRREAYDEHTEVGNVIEAKSKQLAEMLCGEGSGDFFDALSYSLREIMRNVVEHSESRQLGICAQYWPSKNKVEVAILDRGVGLKKTLSRNPHLDVNNDRSAVNYALMPAVSGKAFKGARTQRGPWANSGFGLYMTSRICRNGGNFFIASGDAGMLLTKAKEGKSYFQCAYEGTAVRLVIKTDQISSLAESLKRYKEDGFAFQQTYREIVNINPSAASLMLSQDFDLSLWDKFLATLRGKLFRNLNLRWHQCREAALGQVSNAVFLVTGNQRVLPPGQSIESGQIAAIPSIDLSKLKERARHLQMTFNVIRAESLIRQGFNKCSVTNARPPDMRGAAERSC